MMTVHPRTHGEHLIVMIVIPLSGGSSPYPRGTRGSKLHPQPKRRFIPVPTGNTSSCGCSINSAPVHPRTHGEHIIFLVGCCFTVGSSPYPRGTPVLEWVMSHWERFIPVPTGNTCPTVYSLYADAVHPRTHGEHLRGG